MKFVLIAVFSVLLLPAGAMCAGERVALLPWKVNAAGDMEYVRAALPDMLASRLGAGPVEIIRPSAPADAKSPDLNDAGALAAGKALKADYALYGSLTIFGNAVSMDARLVNVNTGASTPFASKGTGIESVISLVDGLSSDVNSFLNPKPVAQVVTPDLPKAPVVSAPVVPSASAAPAAPSSGDGFIVKADGSKEQAALWRGSDLEGMFVAMTAADLDRDGVKELFLISKNAVVVAKYGSSGMEIINEIKGVRGQNVAVTSVDSDRDGTPEVYVSRVYRGRPVSAAVVYKDGAYALASNKLEWMLRAISLDGGEDVLVGQRLRQIDGFYGGLTKLRKEGDGLKEDGPFEVELPRGVNIFAFEAFNFTASASPDVVTLDDRQYLTLYGDRKDGKGWVKGYKSAEYYGGTLNRLSLADNGAYASGPAPVSIEGRFFQADRDRDGNKELILKKNTPGGLGRSADVPSSFKTGEIISLSWDQKGGAVFENWRTKPVEGYVADFFIDDLDKDGTDEVHMLVVAGTDKLFGTVKSYVLSYRVPL